MRSLLFVLSSALLASGCGLLIDLDPPDPVPGMDAGRRDGGELDGAVACARDEDCDDLDFCNGQETCAGSGVCVRGRPPSCDDGIDCTEDRCEGGACVQTPRDDRCPRLGECDVQTCEPGLGCQPTGTDPARCDDGVECTADSCVGDTCIHTPDDLACPSGEFCAASGCLGEVTCVEDTECPHRTCLQAACISGICRYETAALDPTCGASDPCAPARCEGGTCRIETTERIPCAPTGPCDRAQCMRSSDGASVTCGHFARDGASCPGGVCGAGICSGTTCLPPTCGAGVCEVGLCTGAGCTTLPLDCGVNATCNPSSGACVCAAGFRDCETSIPGCECPIGILDASVELDASVRRDSGVGICAVGFDDCDSNGSCECDNATSFCPPTGGACRPYLICPGGCGGGQVCCGCTGTCYDPVCLSCCMFCPDSMGGP